MLFVLLNAGIFRQKAVLLVEHYTGNVLYSQSIHKLCYPASLTKQMTLYLLFKALRDRKVSMNTSFTASKLAQNQLPSKIGIKAGQSITVRNAILALVVKSANDVAVTIAENYAGSAPAFVRLMNKEAKKLGMSHTRFCNPTGWFDPHQVTTAHDMIILARALYRDFPEYFRFFQARSMYYCGKCFTTHNRVMQKCSYVDGMKTGYVYRSGFNIVVSAALNNKHKRVFCIVMGENSGAERDRKALKLIRLCNGAFREDAIKQDRSL